MIKEVLSERGITEYRIYIPPSNEVYKMGSCKKSAASIIVVFLPYFTKDHDFEGNLSVYTQGTDYHIWVKELLMDVVSSLKRNFPLEDFDIQVDIGEINEKQIAYRCGLGKRGMNSLIINDRYGSFGFLGLILTTATLDAYQTEPKNCLCCMKCMRLCPGQAILGDFTIDLSRCASAISQKKEELSEKEKEILRKSGKIFGCDICQRCCPHNQQVEYSARKDVKRDSLNPADIADLSGKGFMKSFGDRSFSWRGKRIIERNLQIMGEQKEAEKENTGD